MHVQASMFTWCEGCKQGVTRIKLKTLGHHCCWICFSRRAVSDVCHCSRAASEQPHEIQQIKQRCNQNIIILRSGTWLQSLILDSRIKKLRVSGFREGKWRNIRLDCWHPRLALHCCLFRSFIIWREESRLIL